MGLVITGLIFRDIFVYIMCQSSISVGYWRNPSNIIIELIVLEWIKYL